MILTWTEHSLTIQRETGDPKFYGVREAKGESNLLYYLKKHLNKQGFDLIKKRMWKDGNMMDDMQQYLRSRVKKGKAIMLWNGNWAIRGLEEYWNQNKPVLLRVERDIWTPDYTTQQAPSL